MLDLWFEKRIKRQSRGAWFPVCYADDFVCMIRYPDDARHIEGALRLVLKWLNRRSQRRSFHWAGFDEYLKHYPLPKPRIVHNVYTLSPVT